MISYDEPYVRYSGEWPTVAEKLGYEYDVDDQDWCYTAARWEDFADYLRLFVDESENEYVCITALKLMLEAVENTWDDATLQIERYCAAELAICAHLELALYEVHYWCSWEANLEDAFRICPWMRRLWVVLQRDGTVPSDYPRSQYA